MKGTPFQCRWGRHQRYVRCHGFISILYGLVWFLVSWMVLRGMPPFLTSVGLLPLLILMFGFPLLLVGHGVRCFYYPRWARRIMTPRERAMRNRLRRRHGSNFLSRFESADIPTRFRMLLKMKPSRDDEPVWVWKHLIRESRVLLAVIVLPFMGFLVIGLVGPAYAGPQPPVTVWQWAHQISTRVATVVVAQPWVLAIMAALVLLHLSIRRKLTRATRRRFAED